MAVIQVEYLYEFRRIVATPQQILTKLGAEIGLTVCETWTRDPFDRIIVAHAKANGSAPLLTSDETIRANYAHAQW